MTSVLSPSWELRLLSMPHSTPVAITANAIYVASYHATKERYSADGNYFAQADVSGVLTARASTNGVYFYGTTSKFPTVVLTPVTTLTWCSFLHDTLTPLGAG